MAHIPAIPVDEKCAGSIQIEIGIAIEIDMVYDGEAGKVMGTASPQPMGKKEWAEGAQKTHPCDNDPCHWPVSAVILRVMREGRTALLGGKGHG